MQAYNPAADPVTPLSTVMHMHFRCSQPLTSTTSAAGHLLLEGQHLRLLLRRELLQLRRGQREDLLQQRLLLLRGHPRRRLEAGRRRGRPRRPRAGRSPVLWPGRRRGYA